MSQVFDVETFVAALVTLLVIMDPPGTVPVFLSLTGRRAAAARARAAWQAVGVSLLVISVFAVAGQAILTYLGIGIPALQGAGGLLLLLVALDLLTGREAAQPHAAEEVNVALVPLGTPLLAGPGAIAATIVFVREADGQLAGYVALGVAILVAHLVLLVCLRFAGGVIRLIKEGGIMLLAKVAGLLLAAIAVQLIAESVRGFIAGG